MRPPYLGEYQGGVSYPTRSKAEGFDWGTWIVFCLIILPVLLSGLLTAALVVWTVVTTIA